MLTSERKVFILTRLRHEGRVVAKDMAKELGLSEDTLRRDLRELAAEGLLLRVHGGALPASPATVTLADRWAVSPQSKEAVAMVAARHVQPGQVIILDGGTTAVQMARMLPRDLSATVVTHSPSVAVELAGHEKIDVEIIGGQLFKHSMVAMGAAVADYVQGIHADIFFMGVTGVHPEMGLTTGNAEEAVIKRMLSRQAAETLVLASREKIGAASSFRVLPISGVDGLVVAPDTPVDLILPYRELGLTILPEGFLDS
ncbi:DeoR/GlpR family DNA-binding transcription regulator [Acidisoma sp. C75]